MPERFALYYAPAAPSRLWKCAASWLGRDPAGAPVEPVAIPGTDSAVRLAHARSARRYGFHATLKAPMALAPGASRATLEAALARYAADTPAVPIGRLTPRLIDGFLALVPVEQAAALTHAAAAVVRTFEPFRAPLDPADRARRLGSARLTARQVDLLDRFGYPYVMEEFLFHMTLTDRLPPTLQPDLLRAAQAWFADALRDPLVLDRIALFHEPAPGAPFARLADFTLRTPQVAHA